MTIETERLISLIEFAQQSARMRSRPAMTVSEHGLFTLHEHQVRGLPGVRLNIGTEDSGEVWLSVERLHETRPPAANAWLAPWLELTQSPAEEPRLRSSVSGASLINAGTHVTSREMPSEEDERKDLVDPDVTLYLADYDRQGEVRRHFDLYVNSKWRPWAIEERARRQTIRLYAQLFTLKQQLEGGIVEAQLELVWGVGLGVWAAASGTVSYPVLAQLVELSLIIETGEIEIRPRDVEPRLQLDWYASVDNPGVASLEKDAAAFFAELATTFSPFDRGTYEPLLRAASTRLDANGCFWPDQVAAEDRSVPPADKALKVTDTWVVFARTRTNNLFIQDLEKLKQFDQESDILPPAVAAIVTDPSAENPVPVLPTFRGVSASYTTSEGTSAKPRDLYFPKPFNDEQVRIIQLLDSAHGVVVQGPPGTGKTHTIANVICHYLAEGKRVLVTSMKDAALAVLQEQLPPEIRPLTIALLASEQAGMKQFEYAIQKIASEVQSLNRSEVARDIKHLDERINDLHGKVSLIDRDMNSWAQKNLSQFSMDGTNIEPLDAAREVVANAGQFEWLTDPLTPSAEHAPRFGDQEIARLREARRTLGGDIDYLDASLPQRTDFPDSRDLLVLHQDMARLEALNAEIKRGDIPPLLDASEETVVAVKALADEIGVLRTLRAQIAAAGYPWAAQLRSNIRDGAHSALLEMCSRFVAEVQTVMETRRAFIRKPVSVPADIELDAEIAEAVANLAAERSAFGLKGVLGKAEQKRKLAAVRVLGAAPRRGEDWRHVSAYLSVARRLREQAVRWNALVSELSLPAAVEVSGSGGIEVSKRCDAFELVGAAVKSERALSKGAKHVMPQWPADRDVEDNESDLSELEHALQVHLARARLADVWVRREQCAKALEGRSGRVVDAIRAFIEKVLGRPSVPDTEMQQQWSELMAELARVAGLGPSLATVHEVCSLIEDSGAPQYAATLRLPQEGPVDAALPDNWRQAWRLRRLSSHLDAIDAKHHLMRLGSERQSREADLAKAYRDVVSKRTWLRLAENASPSIRAALQAYLNAIQKIGKGTGKRASRFRSDARTAAALANSAIPCWIMPHYRVSESLPAALGCFDLVVIDEASQSDLSALPALLRAKKVLIVGDDKQVSPEGVGLEEEKVRNLMTRFLAQQVPTFRMQMSPERSIYDLYKVVFAQSGVMLKEHFRCVGPIIEYSKREHYNHELKPLRLPRASERLDPPLVDVVVRDGFREGDINGPEARFIVEEIRAIASTPKLSSRSIGVVSLLADKQAMAVWNLITDELGPEIIERHRIACGDARTFQGKERDIMFLSMVIAPNVRSGVSSRETFAQRYNVAASRARDRMYLVRSVELTDLSAADVLRRALILHFSTPYAQDTARVEDLRALCESEFERQMYDELCEAGYRVTPQVRVGQYRIDMVVEGHNDARLAIECDGDQFHGPDKWAADMQRQRVLERAGWVFWRTFASAFVRRRAEVMADLKRALTELGIEPIGREGAPQSIHTERRDVISTELRDRVTEAVAVVVELPGAGESTEGGSGVASAAGERNLDAEAPSSAPTNVQVNVATEQQSLVLLPPKVRLSQTLAHTATSSKPAHAPYIEYTGPAVRDPRDATLSDVAEGLVGVIAMEGPVLARRAYDVYLSACGIKRLGHELKHTLNRALSKAVSEQRVEVEQEPGERGIVNATVRLAGTAAVVLRSRGPRTFEEIPASELRVVAKLLGNRDGLAEGSEQHQRAILEFYDLKRLTTQVSARLGEVLGREVAMGAE